MCDISLEPCSLWSEVPHKARKVHTCSSCRGHIDKGNTYTRHFSKFEGDVTSEKLCTPCQVARARFTEAHGDLTPTPSDFANMLEDCVVDDIDDEWSSVLSAMRQRRDAARVTRQLVFDGA